MKLNRRLKEIRPNVTLNYLKSEVIPTRKCAKVPIKPTREAGHKHRKKKLKPQIQKGK